MAAIISEPPTATRVPSLTARPWLPRQPAIYDFPETHFVSSLHTTSTVLLTRLITYKTTSVSTTLDVITQYGSVSHPGVFKPPVFFTFDYITRTQNTLCRVVGAGGRGDVSNLIRNQGPCVESMNIGRFTSCAIFFVVLHIFGWS